MPTSGAACMMMPGSAPSTPASQAPFLLATWPLTYSAVSSPKYQTFPSESCAYQSSVSSIRSPLGVRTSSCTTTQSTPITVLVSDVTVTVIFSPGASYFQTAPTGKGHSGLSITLVKFAGSISGMYAGSGVGSQTSQLRSQL